MMMRITAVAALLLLLPVLAAQSVAGGFTADVVVNPVSGGRAFAFAPDGRLFYIENGTGQIMVVTNPTTTPGTPTVFATVSGFVAPASNDLGGHGLCLHPSFPLAAGDSTNRFVFVCHTTGTAGAPQLVVKRFLENTAAPGTAVGGSETTLFSSIDMGSSGNNFGGRVGFDSAGLLYVSSGDGGAAISLAGTFAQDVNDRRGKLLRYQDNGTIPLSNPLTSNAMWARGMRNPRGMAVNPDTNDLFCVDSGNPAGSGPDEINVILSAANYGWDASGNSGTQSVTGYTNPAFNLSNTYEPSCVAFYPPTGTGFPSVGYRSGVVYVGSEAAAGAILRVVLTGGNQRLGVAQVAFAGSFSAPVRDIKFGPDGHMYVMTDTVLYRLRYTGNTSANPTANAGIDQTVNEGATVTLNGTASSDPDVSDVLRYVWRQTGGSTVVTITNPTASSATFTAPAVTFDQSFTFELILEDGNGGVSNDFVIINVQDTGNNGTTDEVTGFSPPGEGGCSSNEAPGLWLLLATLGALGVLWIRRLQS